MLIVVGPLDATRVGVGVGTAAGNDVGAGVMGETDGDIVGDDDTGNASQAPPVVDEQEQASLQRATHPSEELQLSATNIPLEGS